jgi:hypothetical protein
MKSLLSVFVALLLGLLSVNCVAQSGGDFNEGADDSADTARHIVVDAIYPNESRIVINDQEYFLEGTVLMNGQSVSARSVSTILRQGQKLINLEAEVSGEQQRRVLKEVDTL